MAYKSNAKRCGDVAATWQRFDNVGERRWHNSLFDLSQRCENVNNDVVTTLLCQLGSESPCSQCFYCEIDLSRNYHDIISPVEMKFNFM